MLPGGTMQQEATHPQIQALMKPKPTRGRSQPT